MLKYWKNWHCFVCLTPHTAYGVRVKGVNQTLFLVLGTWDPLTVIFIPQNLIEQKFKNFDPPFCSLNLFISNFFYLVRTKKHDLYRHAKFGYDPKKSNETAAKSANPAIYFETDYSQD